MPSIWCPAILGSLRHPNFLQPPPQTWQPKHPTWHKCCQGGRFMPWIQCPQEHQPLWPPFWHWVHLQRSHLHAGDFCRLNLYHAFAWPTIRLTNYPIRPTLFAWTGQYLPSCPLAYSRWFMIDAYKFTAATLRFTSPIWLPHQPPTSNCSSMGLLGLDYPLTRIWCKLIPTTPSCPQFFVLLRIQEPSLSATWTKQILMQTIAKPCGCRISSWKRNPDLLEANRWIRALCPSSACSNYFSEYHFCGIP